MNREVPSNIIYDPERVARARQDDLFVKLVAFIDAMRIADQNPNPEAREDHRLFKRRALDVARQLGNTMSTSGINTDGSK